MAEGMIREQRFCRECAVQSYGVYGVVVRSLPLSDGVHGHYTRTPINDRHVAGYRLANKAGQVIGYAICILFAALCHAEELPDPTRPPAIITIPAATAGSAPSGLQSIIISKTRRAAIIDGETVELRGKHGDATLIEVSETGVVLQGAQGRQALTLFPDVKIMQKEIEATPKLPVKEGGLAQKTKLKARKEHK